MCLLLQHHQQANWICGKERGVHMTSHEQADSAGWVHVGAGVGCRGLIHGRMGDILSLLITVWILCILNNTFTWFKQDKQVMWHQREGGLGKKESERVWSLRNRWKTIEMVDNCLHKGRQSEVCKWEWSHTLKPGTNREQVSGKYKVHHKACMATVFSVCQDVQQCSFILLKQYAKEPVVSISWNSYRPTAELTCLLLFNAKENQ